MKVLDTDTCIAIIRGDHHVISRRAADPDLMATTWINVGELFYGARKSRRPAEGHKRTLAFLQTLPVLGLDAEASDHFGRIKAELEARGEPVADADLWIASIALGHGAPVVTGNLKHYERIDGLHVEDWFDR